MFWVGTSGYNYPEWKGSFYPDDLPAKKMLPYYAARFPTVEINYTFYRMPTEKLVAGWAEQTPSPYKLTLKAPRRITHDSRLQDTGDDVKFFCDVAGTLGDKLGTLLFQLPPFLKKDLALLDAFLAGCRRRPRGLRVSPRRRGSTTRSSSGWRRATWPSASPTARSSRRPCASPPTTRTSVCATKATSPTTSSAGPTRSRAMPRRCRDVFVYFKHEESGKGPEFARLLMDRLGV